jgi:hypothetical protein
MIELGFIFPLAINGSPVPNEGKYLNYTLGGIPVTSTEKCNELELKEFLIDDYPCHERAATIVEQAVLSGANLDAIHRALCQSFEATVRLKCIIVTLLLCNG